jgi:hypothetical protein
MDLQERPAGEIERVDGEQAPGDMSLNDFVTYARTLQSQSCTACGTVEAVDGTERCEACAAPSLTDRLGPLGRLWRRVSDRLGLA